MAWPGGGPRRFFCYESYSSISFSQPDALQAVGHLHDPPDQQQLGSLAGVSRQTISQIERGDYSPSVTLALKLAKICGVRVEDIFTYQEDETHE